MTPLSSLGRAVGDQSAFLSQAWGRRPHLHASPGDDFSDLLSLDAVDELLTSASLRAPAFRLVRAGAPLTPNSYTRRGRLGSRTLDDLIDVPAVYRHFSEGATIVLQGLHRYWPALTRFCRDLELQLTHPVQANAYITPPVAQGLRVHFDGHDVFAMQTYGSKRWVVHEPVSHPGARSDETAEAYGEPIMDLSLQPGDSLYLPSGTPHAAATVDRASVHITIGLRVRTWTDLVRDVFERAEAEPAFAEALPAGFAADPAAFKAAVAQRLSELTAWVGKVDSGSIGDALVDRFWSSRPSVLRGQLPQLLARDDIGDDTVVRRRPQSVCRLRRASGSLLVFLGDRTLRMPWAVESAMRLVAERPEFVVSDLAPMLDEPGRLVLVRRLVTEGLLTVDRG